MIRDAVIQAGMNDTPFGPLASVVKPGMTVLVKPNWVLHRNQAGLGTECLITHPTFVLAALDEVLKARPARVILGDAPVQLCRWDEIVTSDFRQQVEEKARKAGVAVELVDFRRTKTRSGNLADGVENDLRAEREYTLFDLGKDSLLDPVASSEHRFRVTNYDPGKLRRAHSVGRHQYLVCRESLEADAVLSLPKLKTHRKAGLSGALKNLVGINGNKDYLPHHRIGGTDAGGDCYPGRSLRKRMVEFFLDMANRRIGTRGYRFWSYCAQRNWASVASLEEGGLEGGWYGNDTCWRMVLDLNRILLYGRPDGSLAESKQRALWTLTDAIVCGEGEGPLGPSPRCLGVVTFSECSVAADIAHAALFRFDAQRIPCIREARRGFRWPLCDAGHHHEVYYQGRQIGLSEVGCQLGAEVQPPAGWRGHIEMARQNR
jgi:uncharacterized protein (DUF362 family)